MAPLRIRKRAEGFVDIGPSRYELSRDALFVRRFALSEEAQKGCKNGGIRESARNLRCVGDAAGPCGKRLFIPCGARLALQDSVARKTGDELRSAGSGLRDEMAARRHPQEEEPSSLRGIHGEHVCRAGFQAPE